MRFRPLSFIVPIAIAMMVSSVAGPAWWTATLAPLVHPHAVIPELSPSASPRPTTTPTTQMAVTTQMAATTQTTPTVVTTPTAATTRTTPTAATTQITQTTATTQTVAITRITPTVRITQTAVTTRTVATTQTAAITRTVATTPMSVRARARIDSDAFVVPCHGGKRGKRDEHGRRRRYHAPEWSGTNPPVPLDTVRNRRYRQRCRSRDLATAAGCPGAWP